MKAFVGILFLLMTCTAVQAQISFDTKLSKKRIGMNERLRVDFKMNQDGDNFTPPGFEGFRVVGGPNQAISNSWINGKRSYSKTYSYMLSPQSKGSFTIGQATIDIKGQTYKTPPVAVTVIAARKVPKDGNNLDYIADENVHLVAEISKSSPYVNEAITVTYKMYVSHEVSITSNWREIDTPKYADFWSQNIDNNGSYKVHEGQYNGEDYRYVILRTTLLYPQKSGKLEIEPLTLDVPIDVLGSRRGVFGRRMMSRVNKTISAGRRTINVKSLPLEGKPDNFLGAVGDFKLDVSLNKNILDANEALELSVKVNGKGNLKLTKLPKVKLPSSLEVYEPEHKENIRITRGGMNGVAEDIYTVVPQFKGNYPIRPISFSYFNPKIEQYQTLFSEEIVITVENGPLNVESSELSENGTTKQEVMLDQERFRNIKLKHNLQPIAQIFFFKSPLFWSLVGGPFLLLPLFIVAGRKRKKRLADITGNRLRKADRLAKKYLGEAKKNMNDKGAFYEALERALHNYLRAKLDIVTVDMSKDRITSLLTERQISGVTTIQFNDLLKSCEFARYTPASNVTVQQDYIKAVETISIIDKHIQNA
mgnify:CR=1 FL=1